MDTPSPDLLAALKAAGLEKFFAGCTTAHRREYIKWIGEAKKPATRETRIRQTVQMLIAKQKSEAKSAS